MTDASPLDLEGAATSEPAVGSVRSLSRAASAEQRAAAERSRTAFARQRAAAGDGVPADAGSVVVVPVGASPRVFAEASLSANTVRAYRSDLQQFARWRAEFLDHEISEPHELEQITTAPVDPTEVAAFLADRANAVLPDGGQRYAPATISRYVTAIGSNGTSSGCKGTIHRDEGCPGADVTCC